MASLPISRLYRSQRTLGGSPPVAYGSPVGLPNQYGYGAAANPNSPLQLVMQLIGNAGSGYAEAKKANEDRRDAILKGRTDTRNRVLDQWNGYGDSLVNDTNQQFDKAKNDSIAHLSQLGMLGSTNVEALNTQNAKERLDATRRVKDDITQNYAQADERLSNNIDDFQERIVDPYPDNNQMASLAALLPSLLASGQFGGYGGGQPQQQMQPSPIAGGSTGAARAAGGGGSQSGAARPAVAPAGYTWNPATGKYEKPLVGLNPNALPANAMNPQQELYNRLMNELRSTQNGPNAGMSGNHAEQQVLNQLQENGLANWNPLAGGQGGTIRAGVFDQRNYGGAPLAPVTTSGGGGGAIARGPAYDQRMAATAKTRQAGQRVNRNAGGYYNMEADALNQMQTPEFSNAQWSNAGYTPEQLAMLMKQYSLPFMSAI